MDTCVVAGSTTVHMVYVGCALAGQAIRGKMNSLGYDTLTALCHSVIGPSYEVNRQTKSTANADQVNCHPQTAHLPTSVGGQHVINMQSCGDSVPAHQ